MIDITQKEARRLSRIGSRATYGMAMYSLTEDNPDVYALSADLGGSSGLQRLMQARPDRFMNVGIAEQNLIGFAAGLAREGIIPFVSSFAPFITFRCLDQIKMNLGYMRQNVKLVGLGSGFAMGELGNSHYGLEDVAVMRAIPNIAVVQPADCISVVKAVYAASEYEGGVYIRLTGTVNVPVVYSEDFDFQIGKSITVREGEDVSVIAAGSMVATALEAAYLLEKEGISCSVTDMHTVKPLDTEVLDRNMEKNIPVVTLEEHSVIGGLGSAVAEYSAVHGKALRHKLIGIPDQYGHTADYGFQLKRYGLTAEDVAIKIKKFLEEDYE